MPHSPIVSIVMPVYNTEKFLKDCIESIIGQTFSNFELLCVDDGSTDSSLQILKDYQTKDSRIKILQQKNLYAGVARNTGMANASGKYIMFLDSDDWYELNMVETALDDISSTNSDISVFQYKLYNEQTKNFLSSLQGYKSKIPEEFFSKTFSIQDTQGKIFSWVGFGPCHKIFKLEFLNKNNIKFQETKISNDVMFFFETFAKAQKISLTRNVLGYYRKYTGNSISDNRWKSLQEYIKIFEVTYKKISSLNYFPEIEHSYRKAEFDLYFYYLNLFEDKDISPYFYALKKYFKNTTYGVRRFKNRHWYNDYLSIKNDPYFIFKLKSKIKKLLYIIKKLF